MLAVSRANAQEFPFIEKKLDLTLSLLPASSRNASLRIESNINIYKVVRIPFLKKAAGYVALTQFDTLTPRGLDLRSGTDYQCELQLRTARTVSPKFLYFYFTGNTLNFGAYSEVSLDIGGGLRYALWPEGYLSLTALFAGYYPDGVVATFEPGIVWRGFALSCRAANAFPQNGNMPAGSTTLAIGYRLSL